MIWLALSGGRTGLNLWSDLVTGLSESSVLTGPLAAGFTAWFASRWASPARARMENGSRARPLVYLRSIAELLGPIVLAFPLAVLVLVIYAGLSGTYGAPSLSWLFSLWACLFVTAALGYMVGAVVGRRWFTAPLATLIVFGGYVLVQALPLKQGGRSLFPALPHRDTEFARYIDATMWSQVLLFSAAGFLFILIAASYRRRLRIPTAAAAAAAVVLAVVDGSVIISTNGQYLTGYNHRDFECSASPLTLCLNRGYAGAMQELESLFEEFNKKADGTPLVATVLEQNVEGIGDAPAQGARSVYLEGIDPDGLKLAVFRYVTKYGGYPACVEREAGYEQVTAVAIVDTWLADFDDYGLSQLDAQSLGFAEWQHFSQLSTEEGNAWLRDHEQDYLACNLSLSDLM
ncbi:hypothetical protein [Microbacterium sp. CIAB417]|uniref:hypothetical protein n=1 Tax=Microbacterium sp. CIAB417 TaxID=2860287 RepID=UPI001FAC24C8|nr:hypothetical protein [Microbacterium sp. CIAB417]